MKRLLSIGVAAALPLFALEECDRGFVPLPAQPGAGSYSAPASAPANTAPGYARPLRIDDPDQLIQSQIIDYVWGIDGIEAERRCRQLAAKAGLRFVAVRQTSRGGNRYECHVDTHPEATVIPGVNDDRVPQR